MGSNILFFAVLHLRLFLRCSTSNCKAEQAACQQTLPQFEPRQWLFMMSSKI
jgi:hypothetical protein